MISRLATRRFLALAGLLLALSLSALGQEEVSAYLRATDPILSGIASLSRDYQAALKDFRQKRDLTGVRAYIVRQCAAWSSLREQLEAVPPPRECAVYHGSMLRMLELQLAMSELSLQVADGGLALTAEVKALRDSGATDTDIQERVAAYSQSADTLNAGGKAMQEEARALDQTLKAEHERLEALVPPPPSPETSPSPASDSL